MTNTILIVEDDLDGQALVSHVVNYMALDYDIAGDAETAERFLFQSDAVYHAILVDLGLPGKSGWELLQVIREHPKTAGITCIAVTAFHTSKTREQALQSGFDAYFSKPIDANKFAMDLEKIL
ncbi:MAG: response regulator [Anaerolineae bacterium]